MATPNPFQEGGQGKLGEWDVLGNEFDKLNPYLDTSGRDKQDLLKEIAAKWGDKAPLILEEIKLKNPEWLADVDPELIDGVGDVKWDKVKTATVDGTAFDDISSDPRLRDEQMASLGALKELADNGGMNSQDEANLARIQSQVGQADRGRREAILQNAAQRGMGGSGMEMLAQLDSSQAATDRQSQEGLDVAGMAQARALEAMMQGGNMAGSIRGQDWSEEAQRAAARDAINTFNTGNINQHSVINAQGGFGEQTFNANKNLDVQKTNTGAVNQAKYHNNAGAQAASNAAVDNDNKTTIYNKTQLPQANYDNSMKLDEKKDAANVAVADGELDLTEQKAKKVQGIGQMAAMFMSDERKKKDVKDVNKLDMEAFLASLQPKKYKYKDEANGQGDFTGIMAQDLLKSEVGAEAAVQDEEGTLGYDKDKMQGVILAALKHLSDKIDRKG